MSEITVDYVWVGLPQAGDSDLYLRVDQIAAVREFTHTQSGSRRSYVFMSGTPTEDAFEVPLTFQEIAERCVRAQRGPAL